MKLSKRLKTIEQMITADYTHIWDCCCDHGSLGMSLLTHRTAPNIHFVDIVPELMTKIDRTLEQFFSQCPSIWTTHCLDVAKLPLTQYSGNHLIIIAGVGGDLMIEFINAITKKYSELTIDFLLCPIHHQFALRKQLIKLDFNLKNEVLIEENKRFYEVILVNSTPLRNQKVSLVGDNIWQSNNAEQANIAQRYLTKTLNHYRRIQQGNSESVDDIIKNYLAVDI